jgi:hypothetical protein
MVKNCCVKHSSNEKKVNGADEISVCGSVQVGHTASDDPGKDCDCCDGSESTKIIAEVDVGFGNTLYIRGAGCGLSWDKGVAMHNKDAKFWTFECNKCKCKGNFEYKFLINDEIWCTGDNLVAKCCKKNIASPKF